MFVTIEGMLPIVKMYTNLYLILKFVCYYSEIEAAQVLPTACQARKREPNVTLCSSLHCKNTCVTLTTF